MTDLLSDLAAEHAALDAALDRVADWERPTPAQGWTIADCVAHLWHFDGRAAVAATEPDRFNAELGREPELVASTHGRAHELGAGLRGEWRARAAAMIDAFRAVDPSVRVPWYGPPMSVNSFVTARLMETWAHGQDVIDALGLPPIVSDRLRHVAFIGVRARPFCYLNRGRAVPGGDVRVELLAPDGASTWTFGESATDVVRGSALDFCLVVTQRRHRDDTDLVIDGPLAQDWMAIAQAFAGPPTDGRPRR